MDADRAETIEALLIRAEDAHGRYEAEQLHGVYDQEWPRWYAEFIVDHGGADVLAPGTDAAALGAFLGRAFADFEQLSVEPAEPWHSYVARRLATEL